MSSYDLHANTNEKEGTLSCRVKIESHILSFSMFLKGFLLNFNILLKVTCVIGR
jgi:hypothetical protein